MKQSIKTGNSFIQCLLQGAGLLQPSTKLPVSSRSTTMGAAAPEAGTDNVAALEQKVVMLEQELADSERTHQLRLQPYLLLLQLQLLHSGATVCLWVRSVPSTCQ